MFNISKDEYSSEVKALVKKLMNNRKYENADKNGYHLTVIGKVVEYFENIHPNDCIKGCIMVHL